MGIKFVRWLGAFGTGASLSEAASWELSQLNRQVAVEPLWRGLSLIDHAKIGLAVDHEASVFVKGWTCDAYTQLEGNILKTARPDSTTRQGKAFRSLDRFLSAWNRKKDGGHGEAVFDAPHYTAVVVKRDASERGFARARKLADQTGLPLVVL